MFPFVLSFFRYVCSSLVLNFFSFFNYLVSSLFMYVIISLCLYLVSYFAVYVFLYVFVYVGSCFVRSFITIGR